MKTADLHLHTKASDGSDSIQERIKDAAEKDLDAIALTDHDTINSELTQRSFVDEETGVKVVTGAEIKCKVEETSIEILGYFLDPESKEINELLDRISKLREDRIREMTTRLNQENDAEITLEDVFEKVGGNPGRPHIAEALIDSEDFENVQSQKDAFKLYIGEECPAYIPTPKLNAEEVIETVLENGGVPVLAHPGRDLDEENAEEITKKLKESGLKGIEVYYSWEHKKRNNFGISFGEEKCRELAEEYGLIETGGSDCHGSETDKYLIGTVELSFSQVQKLESEAAGL